MAALSSYVGQVAVFVVLMAVVQIVMPRGSVSKYVRLVMAAVLMFVMIRPIEGALSLLSGGGAGWLAGAGVRWDGAAMRREAAYYDEAQRAAVLARYQEELAKTLGELAAAEGWALTNARFDVDGTDERFGQIHAVHMTLAEAAQATKPPLIRVEQPKIRLTPYGQAEDVETNRFASIKKTAASFYNVPEEHIYIGNGD